MLKMWGNEYQDAYNKGRRQANLIMENPFRDKSLAHAWQRGRKFQENVHKGCVRSLHGYTYYKGGRLVTVELTFRSKGYD